MKTFKYIQFERLCSALDNAAIDIFTELLRLKDAADNRARRDSVKYLGGKVLPLLGKYMMIYRIAQARGYEVPKMPDFWRMKRAAADVEIFYEIESGDGICRLK